MNGEKNVVQFNPVKNIVEKLYGVSDANTPVFLDSVEDSIDKIKGNLDVIVNEYRKVERFNDNGLIGKFFLQMVGQKSNLTDDQMYDIMEKTLYSVAITYNVLVEKNERDYIALANEYDSITKKVERNANDLCLVYEDVEKLDQKLSEVGEKLSVYIGNSMDFSKKDSIKDYFSLKKELMVVEREASQKAQEYMLRLNQLKIDMDTAAETTYWSKYNNAQQLSLKSIVAEAKNKIDDFRRQKGLYGSVAWSSKIISSMYSTTQRIREVNSRNFIDNLDSVKELEDTYNKRLVGNEQEMIERKSRMDDLMGNIQNTYSNAIRSVESNEIKYA